MSRTAVTDQCGIADGSSYIDVRAIHDIITQDILYIVFSSSKMLEEPKPLVGNKERNIPMFRKIIPHPFSILSLPD